jgi:uncharacterized membrane protein YjgN (DUF898 family)
MSKSLIRVLVLGLFSIIAALITAQWVAGNVAVQIGGSGNKIEQKVEYNNEKIRKSTAQ